MATSDHERQIKDSVLEVEHITKSYDRKGDTTLEVLRNINFSIAQGEFVSIIGASGCGKTTLLKIIAGLITADSGRVVINDNEISGPNPRETAIAFQEDALLPWLNIETNVALGLEASGTGKKERINEALEWITRVGLEGYEKAYPHQLSGGMRQRAALARALVLNPQLLLLDEPLGALDEQTRNLMADELRSLHLRIGGGMLMITHSLTEAVLISDRVVVMSSRPGQIAAIVDIPLGRDRDVTIVDDIEFVQLRHKLWELLAEEWTAQIK